MNFSVFQFSSTSVSLESPLPVSSSVSEQKPLQDGTTTTEPTKPSSESIANPVSNVYWPNVLNSPISLMDEQENLNSKVVQTRKETKQKKRLHWWF